VLLFNSRMKLFPGKLHSCWSGPIHVKRVMSSGAVELWSESTSPFVANGQRLKHNASRKILRKAFVSPQ